MLTTSNDPDVPRDAAGYRTDRIRKSTTLYGALNLLRSPTTTSSRWKIRWYMLDGVNQSRFMPKQV